jgi:hypothetical protein
MIVRRIQLGPNQDIRKFIQFMREEYLPAIRRGPTRIGQANYVELFQGNTTNSTDQFLLLVEGLMSLPEGFVGTELAARLREFAPEVEEIADNFRSVARWTEDAEISPSI